jgi:hypothetical protein
MLRWQRRTASTCPNAYYSKEGDEQSMYLMLSQAAARLIAKTLRQSSMPP